MNRSVNNHLAPSSLGLKTILGSKERVCIMLKKSRWVLKCDLDRAVMLNIELMKSCGISSTYIGKYMVRFQSFFTNNPERMKGFVKRVDEMGFSRNSNLFIYAIRIMSSMSVENWEHKLQLFKNLGISEDDILCVFKRHPQAFGISEKKLMEVTQMLFTMGNIDLSSIIRCPVLLASSIEHRLKPRLKVMEILETKNLLKKKPTLTTVLKITEKAFLAKYVTPYSKELRRFDKAAKGSSNLPKTWLA